MRDNVDRAAPAQGMRSEVWEGLTRPQKRLSPRFFYDERGSRLFDEITTLPEYYPTRLERELLHAHATSWLQADPPRTLIELGAGSADKTRVLLDAMPAEGSWYVPIDISVPYLVEVGSRLGAEYPKLRIHCVEADISRGPVVPQGVPRPLLIAFLGSTIGNFAPREAAALLGRIRRAMGPDDRFLLGADLVKPTDVLDAAYNDARGVTAEFNLNMLRVLNRELGTDFDVSGFEHRAFYRPARSRIEMHLVSRRPQTVTVPGRGQVRFSPGESVRTEISCKYTRCSLERLLGRAGLAIEHWVTDRCGWYALLTARPQPA